jgi:hypothetical protein
MVTKAATTERTAVTVRDWRDLTARDWSEIIVATVVLLSLAWLIWSQMDQNKRMVAIQDQLTKQSADISALNSQLARMSQDQAAAEARRAATPTMIVPPVAPSFSMPSQSQSSTMPSLPAPSITNGSGTGSGPSTPAPTTP